jgi:hypothetical protein
MLLGDSTGDIMRKTNMDSFMIFPSGFAEGDKFYLSGKSTIWGIASFWAIQR